jgi:hypothetical protein
MTDRTAAALASALPRGVELRPPKPGSDIWYAREIAEFQAERLAESGYRLVHADDHPQTFAAHTAEAPALIHDHVEVPE